MGKEEAKVDNTGICFYNKCVIFFNCHLMFYKKMKSQTELPIYLKFLWYFSLSLALPALEEASVISCHLSKAI